MQRSVFYKPRFWHTLLQKENKGKFAHLNRDRYHSFPSISARAVSEKNRAEKRKRRHGEEEYEVTCKRLYVKTIAVFTKLTSGSPSLKTGIFSSTPA